MAADHETPLQLDTANVGSGDSLRDPLLCKKVTLVVHSREWEAADVSSDEEDAGPLGPDRHERYVRMAQDVEVYAVHPGASGSRNGRSFAWTVHPNVLRCCAFCFAFVETTMNTVSLALLIGRHQWYSVMLLTPSQILVMAIDVCLARKDRTVSFFRQKLQKEPWWKLACLDASIFAVLGCLCFYPLFCAYRCYKHKDRQPSFLDEIEAQAEPGTAASGRNMLCVPGARFDSHAMFISGVPRIIVLTNRLISSYYSTVEVLIFCITVAMTLVTVVEAIVNFDYHASHFITTQYKESRRLGFQAAHCLYRLCEVAGRALVLVACAVVCRLDPHWAYSVVLLDYLLGLAALCIISGASAQAFVLSFPVYAVDVSRYVDETGVAVPARRLSRFLYILRNLQFLGAMAVYLYYAQQPNNAGPLQGDGATACLALLVLTHTACCGLRLLTRVGHRGADLFTTALSGDIKALEQLLKAGCDARAVQRDALRQTPLHVAAQRGHLECVLCLLRYNADPGAADTNGEVPLHLACRRGHAQMITTLLRSPEGQLSSGQSAVAPGVARQNRWGKTPAQVLGGRVPASVVQLLSQEELRGSDEEASSALGPQPLLGSGDRTRAVSEELRSLFGPLLGGGGSHYARGRCRTWPRTEQAPEAAADGLASMMFACGVGEQLAQLLEESRQRGDGHAVRLSALKLLKTLGTGGFGKVLQVLDTQTGEVYAMKLQKKHRTEKTAARVAAREALALNWSNHAFIVRLFDVFQTKSFYAILMELCATNLNEQILGHVSAASGRAEGLPEERTSRYSACVTLALQYLHGKGIIFRDLKPENVLLTSPEKGDYAKLTDFGLASPIEELSPICGTAGFMAAEVWEDSQDAETLELRMRRAAARDWYAFGCCILLMLLGERGGSKISMKKRDILLPPAEEDIPRVLRHAVRERRIDSGAFCLVSSLTAPLAERAGAEDARRSPFLEKAITELEIVARHHECRISKARVASSTMWPLPRVRPSHP